MPLDSKYTKVSLDLCDYNPGHGNHRGVDIKADDGENVYPLARGVVFKNHKANAKYNDHWNACLIVTHEVSGKTYYTYYAHITSELNAGDEVIPGVGIGTVNLGHLHISVKLNFEYYWGYDPDDQHEPCDVIRNGGWMRFQDVFGLQEYQ